MSNFKGIIENNIRDYIQQPTGTEQNLEGLSRVSSLSRSPYSDHGSSLSSSEHNVASLTPISSLSRSPHSFPDNETISITNRDARKQQGDDKRIDMTNPYMKKELVNPGGKNAKTRKMKKAKKQKKQKRKTNKRKSLQ